MLTETDKRYMLQLSNSELRALIGVNAIHAPYADMCRFATSVLVGRYKHNESLALTLGTIYADTEHDTDEREEVYAAAERLIDGAEALGWTFTQNGWESERKYDSEIPF